MDSSDSTEESKHISSKIGAILLTIVIGVIGMIVGKNLGYFKALIENRNQPVLQIYKLKNVNTGIDLKVHLSVEGETVIAFDVDGERIGLRDCSISKLKNERCADANGRLWRLVE